MQDAFENNEASGSSTYNYTGPQIDEVGVKDTSVTTTDTIPVDYFSTSGLDTAFVFKTSDSGLTKVSDVSVTVTGFTYVDLPVISQTIQNQPVLDDLSIRPFATVTLSDPSNPGGVGDAITIAIATDAGTLSLPSDPSGLIDEGNGVYELAFLDFGTVAQQQAGLEALVFTPFALNNPAGVQSATFTITDTVATGNQGSTTDSTTTVLILHDAHSLSLGLPQYGTDAAPFSAFAGVSVADPYPGDTVSAVLTVLPGEGSLSGPGLSVLPNGNYVLAATDPATLTDELQSIQFASAPGQIFVGTTATLGDLVTITASAADGWSDSQIDYVYITETAVAPSVDGFNDYTVYAEATSQPFANAAITDPNLGTPDVVTITTSGRAGTLTGMGLSGNATAGYTLTGSATQVTAELQALTFTPNASAPNSVGVTLFTVTDTANGLAASDNGFLVEDIDPHTQDTFTITSAEASAVPTQVITGTVSADAVTGDLTLSSSPLSVSFELTDTDASGDVLETIPVTSDADGNFSVAVTLPALGANIIATSFGASDPTISVQPGSVTDTLLVAQPIIATASPTTTTAYGDTQALTNGLQVASNPFHDVVITEPNTGALLSATVTLSGGAGDMVSAGPLLQNLTATALAAALDQTVVELTGAAGHTDTVTATITDTAGQTTTLVATDTLQPTLPIIASESPTSTTVYGDTLLLANGLQVATNPFQNVVITDPNGALLSATITLSGGPGESVQAGPSLQNLTAAALATALEQTVVTLAGTATHTDTVTATITDATGETTTLVSSDTLAVTHAVDAITITSPAVATIFPNQTITGTATVQEVTADGTVVSTAPVPNATVMVVDATATGSSSVSTSTDSDGDFSVGIKLGALGADSITAVLVPPLDALGVDSNSVTDTLLAAQPITAGESPTSTTVYVNSDALDLGFTRFATNPFQNVVITDPNSGALLSATVTASFPGGAIIGGPSLQNLSATALAAALDQTTVQLFGTQGYTETLTATITDTTGETTTLVSTDTLAVTHTVDAITITSPAESSTNPSQTITGTLTADEVTADGTTVSSAPVAGATIAINDSSASAPPKFVTTDSNGDFTGTVTLGVVGANTITASTPTSGGSGVISTVIDFLFPVPITASASPTSTTTYVNFLNFENGSPVATSPFQNVAITDPNPDQLFSASVTVSGQASAQLSGTTSFDNLSAAALAAALDKVALTFYGNNAPNGGYSDVAGAETVTATITDSAGQTTTLTTTDTLQLTQTQYTFTITNPPETTAVATQTITGTVTSTEVGNPSSPNTPAAGIIFSLRDTDGSSLASGTSDSSGNFSVTVTLPIVGTNILSVSSSINDVLINTNYVNYTLLAPQPVTETAGQTTTPVDESSSNTTVAEPITAGESPTSTTVYGDTLLLANGLQVATNPFQNVVITEPNGALLSATITLSGGPGESVQAGPSLQNLTAAALATALEQTVVTLAGTATHTDTVTATITDATGETTTLVSSDTLTVTHAVDAITITSPAVATIFPNQTITGTATVQEVTADGTVVSTAPVPNATVMVVDATATGSSSVSTSTDSDGDFSVGIKLGALGADSITAVLVPPLDALGVDSNSVIDTLLPLPITASASPTSTTTYLNFLAFEFGGSPVATSPFQNVAITDPNADQLLSASVTVSGQASAQLSGTTSFDNLSAAALAAALDKVALNFYGVAGAETVTATITDSAGQTTTLTTTDTLQLTQTQYTFTITSPPETSAVATQTITGTVTSTEVGNPSSPNAPAAGISFSLRDSDGSSLASGTSDSSGNFSVTVTLPIVGTNILSVSSSISDVLISTNYVTDTLLAAQPITAGESPTSTTVYVNSDALDLGFTRFATNPFQNVVITDPNSGALLSATVTASFPGGAIIGGASLQNLSATALAAALEQTTVQLFGTQGYTETLTATITDTTGETTTLVSTDTLAVTHTVDAITITSPAESSTNPSQTITGTLTADEVTADGTTVSSAPVAGATIAINDSSASAPPKFVTTDSNGDFTGTVTLGVVGANTITASTPTSGGSGVISTVIDTLLPPTVTLGSGDSTLAFFLSESAASAGAEFTISVDGVQIGGTQTTSADVSQGQSQEFDVLGNFAAGLHTVSLDYLNPDNSLLIVDSAAIDGAPVATDDLTLSNVGAASFSFLATGTLTPVTVGSGPDTLALTLSERAEPAGAEFTISVDGVQIGGTQTTAADVRAGQSQVFDVMGSFGAGAHTATITYLNAANSLLLVDDATIDGAAIGNSATTLNNNGAADFDFTAAGSSIPTIGTGSDILLLTVSEQGAPQGAEFTISVDGAQIGGTQIATADSTTGQTQQIAVRGEFSGGTHAVSIDDLNADNSLLNIDGASVDGEAIGGSAITLDTIGVAGFSFTGPGDVTPGAAVVGTGSDTLELTTSQRGQPTGALFTVDVDGTQIGGVQTTTADTLQGQTQLLDVLGSFGTGTHTVNLNYLNAANSLLIVGGATINGVAIAGSSTILNNIGTESFNFVASTTHS